MSTEKPPFRPVHFAPRSVELEKRGDGSMILRNPTPLGEVERHINVLLQRAVARAPGRTYLAQRTAGGDWRKLTYTQVMDHVQALAQAFLDRGLGPDKPVMILSGNSIEHALVTLAGLHMGAPVAPVSAAYSLMSSDFAKLKHVFELVEPALIFVQHGKMFEAALTSLDLTGVEVVVADAPPQDLAATRLSDLLVTKPTDAVDKAFAALGPDSVAKYLFTSGSTGLPKGVINTHRMLCANQRMYQLIDKRDPEQEVVILEWLPWSHTFGGNINFFNCVRSAGTMYIDGGKPIPGMFEESLRNLREVSPTHYTNVPAGYTMLLEHLERDEALAENFFRRLSHISYGGANLPLDLWQRMQDVAVRTTGERIVFTTGLGATETAPVITAVHWPIEGTGNVGLPLPGVEIKLVPNGSKMEMRVRGEILTPGYLKRPDLTADAFDEEGFYKIGDAGRLVDPDNPEEGIAFDGRVAEDFKLETGTWVHAGGLRVAALAAVSPLLRDAVVTGHDRPFIGLLAWPNMEAAKEICPDPAANNSVEVLLRCPEVAAHVKSSVAAHNAKHPGSSERIHRVLLMAEPPSIDGGEITDKGYINQRATLERRADLVERLYAANPDQDVIVI
jgi:feruloyl-CoA synthase